MKQRIQYKQILSALLLGLSPLAQGAQTVPLADLEKRLPDVLSVQAAAAALDAAKQGLIETQAQSGWRLGADIAAAEHRPIVRSDVTPRYTGIDSGVKLSYPILGSKAKEQEAIIMADAEHAKSDVDFSDARRQALYALRARYIAYWQAQETARAAEEFRAALAAKSKAAAAEHKEGMWTAADMLHFRQLENQAALEVEKAAGQSKEALSGLRSLLGADLPAFTAEAPVLPAPCSAEALLDGARRSDPTLGHLLAQLNAVRAEQGLTEWRHVDGAFVVGANSTDDVSGHRHGSAAAVGFEFSMPLGVAEAKRARHDRLGASVQQYSLQISQQESELAHKLNETTANYQLAQATVQRAESQAKAATAAAAQSQARFNEAPGNILTEVVDNSAAAHEADIDLASAKANLAAQAAAVALLAPDACNVPRPNAPKQKTAVLDTESKPIALDLPEIKPLAKPGVSKDPEVKPLAQEGIVKPLVQGM